MKLFLVIKPVFLCLVYFRMKLLYVTELNGLLHCTIVGGFVNDRLDIWGWRLLELEGMMGSNDASEA